MPFTLKSSGSGTHPPINRLFQQYPDKPAFEFSMLAHVALPFSFCEIFCFGVASFMKTVALEDFIGRQAFRLPLRKNADQNDGAAAELSAQLQGHQ